jgi:hypothetical protein
MLKLRADSIQVPRGIGRCLLPLILQQVILTGVMRIGGHGEQPGRMRGGAAVVATEADGGKEAPAMPLLEHAALVIPNRV